MRVIISMGKYGAAYHRSGCPYARHIAAANLNTTEEKSAVKHRYRPCKYCSGLQGFARITYGTQRRGKEKKKIEYTYEKATDTLYLRTLAGFWKILRRETGYVLYHRNEYRDELTTREMMHGAYHRQSDVAVTDSPAKLTAYVEAHDKAKRIIAEDYRKLPQKTRRQRQYYQSAQRKDRRRKAARLDQLFEMLEKTGNCRLAEPA